MVCQISHILIQLTHVAYIFASQCYVTSFLVLLQHNLIILCTLLVVLNGGPSVDIPHLSPRKEHWAELKCCLLWLYSCFDLLLGFILSDIKIYGLGMQEMMGTQTITSVTKVKIKILISDRMKPSSKSKQVYNHGMQHFNSAHCSFLGERWEVCPPKGHHSKPPKVYTKRWDFAKAKQGN